MQEVLFFLGVEVLCVEWVEVMRLPVFDSRLSSLHLEVHLRLDLVTLLVSIIDDVIISESCGRGFLYFLNLMSALSPTFSTGLGRLLGSA